MSDSLTVVWDDALKAYDFGPGHPLAPIRVQLAMRLATDFDLLTGPRVSVHTPVVPATAEDLLRVHDADYIAAVERASLD
ncbi:MAG: acetoin utilization protein AcuC, partial [Actinomycetota bacterium]